MTWNIIKMLVTLKARKHSDTNFLNLINRKKAKYTEQSITQFFLWEDSEHEVEEATYLRQTRTEKLFKPNQRMPWNIIVS